MGDNTIKDHVQGAELEGIPEENRAEAIFKKIMADRNNNKIIDNRTLFPYRELPMPATIANILPILIYLALTTIL